MWEWQSLFEAWLQYTKYTSRTLNRNKWSYWGAFIIILKVGKRKVGNGGKSLFCVKLYLVFHRIHTQKLIRARPIVVRSRVISQFNTRINDFYRYRRVNAEIGWIVRYMYGKMMVFNAHQHHYLLCYQHYHNKKIYQTHLLFLTYLDIMQNIISNHDFKYISVVFWFFRFFVVVQQHISLFILEQWI